MAILDFAPLLAENLPPPAAKFAGFPKYNFVGGQWATDKDYAKSRTRLCFANASPEAIRAGIATLAEVCRREFGVPARIANVAKTRG